MRGVVEFFGFSPFERNRVRGPFWEFDRRGFYGPERHSTRHEASRCWSHFRPPRPDFACHHHSPDRERLCHRHPRPPPHQHPQINHGHQYCKCSRSLCERFAGISHELPCFRRDDHSAERRHEHRGPPGRGVPHRGHRHGKGPERHCSSGMDSSPERGRRYGPIRHSRCRGSRKSPGKSQRLTQEGGCRKRCVRQWKNCDSRPCCANDKVQNTEGSGEEDTGGDGGNNTVLVQTVFVDTDQRCKSV